jgi:mannan endo-1,4-beta-mannosidase
MNGNWEKWSPANNGSTPDPAAFVAAWRHVHDLFVQNGATNVVWVWCPNATDVPNATSAPWNHWTNYYPGDTYVDWVGIDGYNWGNTTAASHGKALPASLVMELLEYTRIMLPPSQ